MQFFMLEEGRTMSVSTGIAEYVAAAEGCA